MSDINLFEVATRNRYRYNSVQGNLNTEQLWELPLTTNNSNKADLDSIAREINIELKSVSEDSFVKSTPDKRTNVLENKLEILKYIIKIKLEEQEAAKNASAVAARKQKIIGILADQEDEKLRNASPEELRKELEELNKS